MKVGQSNTYADQACRPMTTTRTRTGKNCRPAADPPTPKIAAKRKDIADAICLCKRNVPKICASTTGYLVFLRRSADCFTDKNGSRKNPGTPTCMCCMCRTPRPVGANQKDPPVPNPKFGTYISRGIPATRLLGRTPKAPPATASTASFHRRAVLVPIFRRNRSPYISHRQQQKKKRTRGAATRARVVAAVRTLMVAAKSPRMHNATQKTEWAIQKKANGDGGGTAERALTFLAGSAHNPLKISVGRVHKITPKISPESPDMTRALTSRACPAIQQTEICQNQLTCCWRRPRNRVSGAAPHVGTSGWRVLALSVAVGFSPVLPTQRMALALLRI